MPAHTVILPPSSPFVFVVRMIHLSCDSAAPTRKGARCYLGGMFILFRGTFHYQLEVSRLLSPAATHLDYRRLYYLENDQFYSFVHVELKARHNKQANFNSELIYLHASLSTIFN